MAEKKICIVANNNIDNKFEAMYYEANKSPLNCILELPDRETTKDKYIIINTGVTISWINCTGYKADYNEFRVIYKGEKLLYRQNIKSTQLVIEILNTYNNMTKEELELLLKELQEKEKTALEISIDALTKEKATLEKQILIYKQIKAKNDEIKDLLVKLE